MILQDNSLRLELDKLSEKLHSLIQEEVEGEIYHSGTIASISLQEIETFIEKQTVNGGWFRGERMRKREGQARGERDHQTRRSTYGWSIEGLKVFHTKRYDAQKEWCRNEFGSEWWRTDKDARLRKAMKYIERIRI